MHLVNDLLGRVDVWLLRPAFSEQGAGMQECKRISKLLVSLGHATKRQKTL